MLYTGVTNNLERRIGEHKNKTAKESFTVNYNANKLIYVDEASSVNDAITREKQIKGWLRKKKIELINNMNPEWRDLSEDYVMIRDSSPEPALSKAEGAQNDNLSCHPEAKPKDPV